MTPEQIALVETTFDRFYPSAYDRFAESFYRRMFAADPALRAMFPDDLRGQRLKLMTTFNLAVHGLRHPASIVPALRQLGAIHGRLGVAPTHYETMDQALQGALAEHLAESYGEHVAAAWQAAFALIAGAMLEGANSNAPAA